MTASRALGSGNLLADRRFEYGRDLASAGEGIAAADLFAQAVELAPHWAAAWFALGEARLPFDTVGAVAAFGRAARLDADGLLGADLALAACGATCIPLAASPAYVQAVFDEYAPRFDRHLSEGLGYRGPALLANALAQVRVPPARFARALDLGCGTGLMGAAVRARVDWLGGVDLSPGMVTQARAKEVYDQLSVDDLIPALNTCGPLDLVTAADVFVYVGDLRPICAAVQAALLPGGLFAFTVQRSDGAPIRVGADRRFAHSADHVRDCATQTGLAVAALGEASTRRDAGADVPGLVCVLAKP